MYRVLRVPIPKDIYFQILQFVVDTKYFFFKWEPPFLLFIIKLNYNIKFKFERVLFQLFNCV